MTHAGEHVGDLITTGADILQMTGSLNAGWQQLGRVAQRQGLDAEVRSYVADELAHWDVLYGEVQDRRSPIRVLVGLWGHYADILEQWRRRYATAYERVLAAAGADIPAARPQDIDAEAEGVMERLLSAGETLARAATGIGAGAAGIALLMAAVWLVGQSRTETTD